MENHINYLHEQILKDNPKVQELLMQYMESSDTFLSSISVKDYTVYNDKWGYHAGTLGSTVLGDTHIKALENIQKMYELGGITTMDIDTLEFALLNCAPEAIGGSILKKSLESYLLGGAALMVFDEGFGEAISYLESMEDNIKQMMPKNLNLYFLNQAYVPASYIIETIYANLNDFYHKEMNDQLSSFPVRNRVIITNNATPPTTPGQGTIEEQFSEFAATTLANINIQFVFMAGMLEIFQNLAKVFKV